MACVISPEMRFARSDPFMACVIAPEMQFCLFGSVHGLRHFTGNAVHFRYKFRRLEIQRSRAALNIWRHLT